VAHSIVTTADIARELGYSPQRVDALIRQAEDFPAPDAVVANGVRLWQREVALKWFADHPRRGPGRPGKDADTADPAAAHDPDASPS
jgi:hypothetical protein